MHASTLVVLETLSCAEEPSDDSVKILVGRCIAASAHSGHAKTFSLSANAVVGLLDLRICVRRRKKVMVACICVLVDVFARDRNVVCAQQVLKHLVQAKLVCDYKNGDSEKFFHFSYYNSAT